MTDDWTAGRVRYYRTKAVPQWTYEQIADELGVTADEAKAVMKPAAAARPARTATATATATKDTPAANSGRYEQAVKLTKEGWTVTQIAAEIGITGPGVSYHLKRARANGDL